MSESDACRRQILTSIVDTRTANICCFYEVDFFFDMSQLDLNLAMSILKRMTEILGVWLAEVDI